MEEKPVTVQLVLPKSVYDRLERSSSGGFDAAIVDAITLYLGMQSVPAATSLQLKKGGNPA
ncbi:MAG TPA: hypothetical protein VK464_08315 [Symbiobacteriaceae bacterium]|jgi:hypothetical protein|nr:hypothetical protein [Symbiobacteriaceae bacterium]